jgi:hypothetical protein
MKYKTSKSPTGFRLESEARLAAIRDAVRASRPRSPHELHAEWAADDRRRSDLRWALHVERREIEKLAALGLGSVDQLRQIRNPRVSTGPLS